jgi:hypothetical protein
MSGFALEPPPPPLLDEDRRATAVPVLRGFLASFASLSLAAFVAFLAMIFSWSASLRTLNSRGR